MMIKRCLTSSSLAPSWPAPISRRPTFPPNASRRCAMPSWPPWRTRSSSQRPRNSSSPSTRRRVDGELEFLGLCEELRVRHGGHEGIAQRLDAFGGNVGRRDIGAGQDGANEDDVKHLFIIIVGHVIFHQRNIRRHFRHFAWRKLSHDVEPAVAQPLRACGLYSFHVPDATRDLAALKRDRGFARARIASDDLEIAETQNVLHSERYQVGIARA